MSSRGDAITRGAACRRGFTLLELLVVVAIIATLAALVGPNILRSLGDSKSGTARTQIELYSMALNTYRLDNDVYPTPEQGLEALRSRPEHGTAPPRWRGPYLSKLVVPDPWGRPYVYASPGRVNPESYDLYTLGRDGKAGGEGEDADVTSWGGPMSATP